ncbi:hypothetical protein HK096_009794, partial [Nowakowskiella sp. JEL0078]
MVLNVAFSPDGRTIISTGFYGIRKFWDVKSGQEIISSEFHQQKNQASILIDDYGWILRKGLKILWLPYRFSRLAIEHKKLVAFGYRTRGLAIIDFSEFDENF